MENYHYLEQLEITWDIQLKQSSNFSHVQRWNAIAVNNNTYKLCTAVVSLSHISTIHEEDALVFSLFHFWYSCQVWRFDIRFWPFEMFQLFYIGPKFTRMLKAINFIPSVPLYLTMSILNVFFFLLMYYMLISFEKALMLWDAKQV